MKKLYTLLLSAATLLFGAATLSAQVPDVVWDDHFPRDYEIGNYTANDIKESPYQRSFVIVGGRNMTWRSYGFQQAMVMRVDDEGGSVEMSEIFTGTVYDSIYENGDWIKDNIPWDQVAYDMIFVQEEDLRYLITGYRDTTLLDAETPPGLFLMEVRASGTVAYDSLYYNHTMHHMKGYSIAPAIGGGCIIAGSIREDGTGPEKILVTRMAKTEEGKWEPPDFPSFKAMAVGENGYARWIRPFRNGYLMAGTAYNGDGKQFDMFLQKIYPDLGADWLTFYGEKERDEFADALITEENIYLAGSVEDTLEGTSFIIDMIYVAKLDSLGGVIWKNTYGGSTRHFANKIMWANDGSLLVAGSAYDQSMHAGMILLSIDEESGELNWMESYGDFYNAGIRDAIPTTDFGFVAVGRASSTATQDPRVYLMKLDPGYDVAYMMMPRENLNLPISPAAPASDAIDFTANVDTIHGVTVIIDTLLHPSVGDLEVSLSHEGATVILADRPENSGENFIETGFMDSSPWPLEWGVAPYTGWWKPVDPLSVFLTHDPGGEWRLTVTDHGTGGTKATSMLVGWSLNLLVGATGGETGIPPGEQLANFGLKSIRPNPVSNQGLISFRIPRSTEVKLTVYNQLGQQVQVLADEHLFEGEHTRTWNPGSLAPGTYFLYLEADGMISIRKALLTR
jgi:hypothetical protein